MAPTDVLEGSLNEISLNEEEKKLWPKNSVLGLVEIQKIV